jgi:hypothetical protein
MPTIIKNQYGADTDLGSAISQLGNTLFGPGRLQADMLREKTTGLRRDNMAIERLQESERMGGFDANDPAARAAIVGMAQPKEFFEAQRGINASRYGAMSPQAANSFVGAGGAFASTGQGFERGQQVELQKADMATQRTLEAATMAQNKQLHMVRLPDGRVVQQTHGEITGAPIDQRPQPVMSVDQFKATQQQNMWPSLSPEDQRRVVGVEPKNPTNLWVMRDAAGNEHATADGVTSLRTGEPLVGAPAKIVAPNTEALGSDATTKRRLVDSRIATEQAVSAIDRLAQGLSQPNADQAVGYIGTVARTFNDIRAQVEATVRFAGGMTVDQELARPEIASTVNNVVTSLFGDAAFNQRATSLSITSSVLRSQIVDLAYSIAKAQDPGGRLSEGDIARAAQNIGATIMDPKAGVAVLTDLKDRLIEGHSIRERVLTESQNNTFTPRQPMPRQPAPQGQTDLYSKWGLARPAAQQQPAPQAAPQAAPQPQYVDPYSMPNTTPQPPYVDPYSMPAVTPQRQQPAPQWSPQPPQRPRSPWDIPL